MEYITLEEIKDNKMYDIVRLVDPIHKKVLDYRGNSLEDTEEICHCYWESGKICDNCISTRAYKKNRSFVKLEQSKSTILLVTAVPILNTKNPVILELMKNVTDSILIGSGEYNEGETFHCFAEELNDMIVKDSLTSLYNRRFVDERLPVDIIDASLNHLPLSVCFIDLDYFKELNDLYGHEAGDWAIKAASDVILKHTRSEFDWAARYGGDEFLLCFYNANEKQAYGIIKRIQQDIEKIPLNVKIDNFKLSLSFGIETMEGNSITAEELIRLADHKMYEAKRIKKG